MGANEDYYLYYISYQSIIVYKLATPKKYFKLQDHCIKIDKFRCIETLARMSAGPVELFVLNPFVYSTQLVIPTPIVGFTH